MKEYVESRGYYLLTKKYVKNDYKILIRDKEGYYFTPRYSDFRSGKNPSKFIKANPYTMRNIRLFLKLNNKPFTLAENQRYEKNSKHLKWKCGKCGDYWYAGWSNIQTGFGCAVCHGKQCGKSNSFIINYPEIASELCVSLNDKLDINKLTKWSDQKVWWQCKENHIYDCTVSNRRIGHGCPYCGKQKPTSTYNLEFQSPEFLKYWDYDKNKLSPKDYTPVSGMEVYWRCHSCEGSFKSRISRMYLGKRCFKCGAASKGELEIIKYLEKNGIKYYYQKHYKDLFGDHSHLYYDFYINKYNLLIEYQGEFHDRPITKGVSELIAIKNFERQKRYDNKKRNYAKENNIRLLEIWYWDFENIETILDKEFLINNKQ